MIVTRSALMLHLQNPPIRYHFFTHFNTSILKPTLPSLFKPQPFSLTTPRNVVTAVASSHGSKGRDTFFAQENVSWTSLGLSDTISRTLSNIGLNRPSLVQVLFLFIPLFFLSFSSVAMMPLLSIHAPFVVF